MTPANGSTPLGSPCLLGQAWQGLFGQRSACLGHYLSSILGFDGFSNKWLVFEDSLISITKYLLTLYIYKLLSMPILLTIQAQKEAPW